MVAATASVVSPELALVDPELAKLERARLTLPVIAAARAGSGAPVPASVDPWSPTTAASSSTAEPASGSSAVRPRPPRRAIAGTGVAVIVLILLLGLREETGKNATSAAPSTADSAVVGLPSTPPVADESPGNGTEPALVARRFAWAPVKGATGYRFEIHTGSHLIFRGTTRHPAITIPRAWNTAGTRWSLSPGEYRWYVWSIESGRRSARAVVQSALTISDG